MYIKKKRKQASRQVMNTCIQLPHTLFYSALHYYNTSSIAASAADVRRGEAREVNTNMRRFLVPEYCESVYLVSKGVKGAAAAAAACYSIHLR